MSFPDLERGSAYVVIPYMACAYHRHEVVYLPAADPNLRANRTGAILLQDAPSTSPGERAKWRREVLIELSLRRTRETGHWTCAVFSAGDSVLVEPDGSTKESKEPPSGGISLSAIDSIGRGDIH